jgi:hypothetical protein
MSFNGDITIHNMASIDKITDELDITIIEEYLKKTSNEEDYIKINDYIEQLGSYDKLALTLSIKILGSSFDLIKSNGFIEWMQMYKKED